MSIEAVIGNLRRIERTLLQSDLLPQLSYPLEFPWEALEEELARRLGLKELHLEREPPLWRKSGKALAELGEPQILFGLACPPIEGPLLFAMAQEDIRSLTKELLKLPDEAALLLDRVFLEEMGRFVAMQIIAIAKQQSFPQGALLRLDAAQSDLGGNLEEEALTFSVTARFDGEAIHGRLILSWPFVQSWRRRYASRRPAKLETSVAKLIDINLGLKVGSVALTREEYSNLSAGDFVTLDHCSFDPDQQTGSALLTLNDDSLFELSLSKKEAKIREQFITCEATPMGKKSDDDDLDEDDFDLDTEDEDDFSDFDEEEDEEEAPQQGTGELDDEEEGREEKGEQEAAATEPLVSRMELPITLSIELGRVKMSAATLSALEPGSLLDLKLPLTTSVDLIAGGACIGRGELIRIGDVAGVRILELG